MKNKFFESIKFNVIMLPIKENNIYLFKLFRCFVFVLFVFWNYIGGLNSN